MSSNENAPRRVTCLVRKASNHILMYPKGRSVVIKVVRLLRRHGRCADYHARIQATEDELAALIGEERAAAVWQGHTVTMLLPAHTYFSYLDVGDHELHVLL